MLLEGVDKRWKVKKDVSRFCRVSPTGILYIGYLLHTIELMTNANFLAKRLLSI